MVFVLVLGIVLDWVDAAGTTERLVRLASTITGTQLRAAGINMNLAPVLDVNDNPRNPVIGIRSFGDDPHRVAALGKQVVSGLLESGVIPCGKHFPGHGNTSVDSHTDLPFLPHDLNRLDETELVPFRAAIESGLPAIMTAHIAFRALDPHFPATLSENVLVGLLRRRLGFDGLILTDCMEMSAIAKSPGTVRGAVQAVKAGADLVLISHTREFQEEAYDALLASVKSGDIPMSRLDEAVSRVLLAKKRFGLPNPLPPEDADDPGSRDIAANLHVWSISVIEDTSGLIPLASEAPVLLIHSTGATGAGSGDPPSSPLAGALRSRGTRHIREVLSHTEGELKKALSEPSGRRTTLVLSKNASSDARRAKATSELGRALLDRGENVVVVATGNPEDLSLIPGAGAYICTYGDRPAAMEALAEILCGRRKASGKPPVKITGFDKKAEGTRTR